jgi:hypothetical protein
MSELRPIGTEFWMVYPVSKQSSGNVQYRFLYRITAHDDCALSMSLTAWSQ